MTTLPFSINPPLPHIREYREEYAEEVARMWRESAPAWPFSGPGGGEHSTAARVRQDQRDLNSLATFIAFLPDSATGEERAVGYCSLLDYTPEANTAYVGVLNAHPDWHGKGIGRDLLRAALERTIALGYERLDLHTWAGNLKAVPLYKKCGYFWAPESSVKMENYLPLIFRLPAAQEFFRQADWYRDLVRDLSLRPDEEKYGESQVYTYVWERDGQFLKVVVDRKARGPVLLGTTDYEIACRIDNPRLPVGGRRTVSWRLLNRGNQPVQVSLTAEGEDAVRCTFQGSASVAHEQEWQTIVTAEQPSTPPSRRPTNRVRSTAVVEGQSVPLVIATQVVQPVHVTFESRERWLSPGVPRSTHVTLENHLDEAVQGTVVLATTPGLTLDRHTLPFALEPRRRVSEPLTLRVNGEGKWALRAHAIVDGAGASNRTKVFEHAIHAGRPGAITVEQDAQRVSVASDRHLVTVALQPEGSRSVAFHVRDRQSGKGLLSHSCSLGPPFSPSVFTESTWRAHVQREDARVQLTLSASPSALPGITLERRIVISPSGLIEVTYRVTNTGDVERGLNVSASTSVDLDMVRGTKVAAPLKSGLVIDDSNRFPDWEEPEVARPGRYAENWMAEFGDGWVGATIWQSAAEVEAGWMAPSLRLDLGAIPPGGQVETDPIYLYTGQGDWRTARALWRDLLSPSAPVDDPTPHPAHRATLERFVFDTSVGVTVLRLESERTRSLTGTLSLEGERLSLDHPEVKKLSFGNPHVSAVTVQLPDRAEAVPVTIVFDHERSTERYDAALLRIGDRESKVSVGVDRRDGVEHVKLENGRLRLTIVPSQLARVAELSTQDWSGMWVNHLFSPTAAPDIFVWFNPWYGGIHPNLGVAGSRDPGALEKESFTWEESERTGTHGVRWHGITARTEMRGDAGNGLNLTAALLVEISYLTAGMSNVLAVPFRIHNRSGARLEARMSLDSFLQPGGDRTSALLHYIRDGSVHVQKRVHGGTSSSSDHWCAVSGPQGSPAIALVPGSTTGTNVEVGDMGLEGAHPSMSFRMTLAPDQTYVGVGYYIIADSVEQARLYRYLTTVNGLA